MKTQDIRQTKINFYTNVLSLFANVLVGVYYTPFLISQLGLAVYGILPIALIINQYIGVAASTITHSFTRFYSVAIQKGNYTEATKSISSSLCVVLFIIVITIPFSIFLVLNIESLFNVPKGIENSTQVLFVLTICSFFLSMVSSMLNVTLYALNRLDLMNILKIARVALKLILLVLLFKIVSIDIKYVGLANFITEFIVLVASIIWFIKYKPEMVRISIRYYDNTTLIAIMGMSIWVLIQTCGDTLLYRTDNLIVNHFWNSKESGALGAISEIGTYISIVVSVVGSLFGPVILKEYSQNNHVEVKSLMIVQSTIVGCTSAVLTGVISGCGMSLLDLWLGNSMGQYYLWLLIKMIVLPFYAAGGIFAFVYRSWNKMKFPSIGTIVLGIMNLLLMIIICVYCRPVNATLIIILGAIFMFCQCFALNSFCVYNIYRDTLKYYPIIFIKILLSFLVSYGVAFYVSHIIETTSLIQLGSLMVFLSMGVYALCFVFLFDKREKQALILLIK